MARKPWYENLFFLKRRPRLRGIPVDWDRPSDPEAYEKLVHDEGFISVKYWDGGDDLSKYPVIAHDIKDLNEYLLPTFFQFSQQSKHFQNRYYLYQWVFVIGAFLTTVFGAIATLYYDPPGTLTAQSSFNLTIQQTMSYLTALVGAITAFVTALSNRGEPHKRWGKNRRLAEELRMHYFTYLSHLPPYDTQDRVQKLRENVIDIRVKEQENG